MLLYCYFKSLILKARFKYRADTTPGQKYRERKAI